MKAYLSISRSNRKSLNAEVDAIIDCLRKIKAELFIFVDIYRFTSSQEKEMMEQAMFDIDRCDLLIAEGSEKAIGVGLEAGYAKGKGKSVIYIRKASAEHSTTVSGIADHQIVYNNASELKASLEKILTLRKSERS